MEHFDRKEAEHNILSNINFNQEDNDNEMLQEVPNRIMQVPAKNTPEQILQQIEQPPQPLREDENKQRFQSQLQLQLNQMSSAIHSPPAEPPQQTHIQPQSPQHQYKPILNLPPSAPPQTEIPENLQFQQQQQQFQQPQYTRMPVLDSDYEFVSNLTLF